MTKGSLQIAAMLVLFAAPAGAATDENLRRHAIEYAAFIARAHDVLADHIERESTAAVGWSGTAIPGAQTGWLSEWTDAGLRARYCGGELLVYMEAEAPKGIGSHHRDIQMAPRLFLGTSDTGLALPPLHWLEDGQVQGEEIGTVALPECMESLYTESLPNARAALMLPVSDPWLELRSREHHEFRDVSCEPGRHGDGIRERRRVSREQNARGDWTGDAEYGPWEVLVDTCRDDYVYHRTFSEECTWYQGNPFDREMRGIRRWRQEFQVSDEGEQELGEPELVGSTCWDETIGPRPMGEPTTSVSTTTEEDERSCDSGYLGSLWLERTETTTTTTVPWNAAPFVTVAYSAWQEVNNTCELPDDDEEFDDGTLEGRPDGGPGCDGCGRPGDPCDWGGKL